MVIRRSLSTVLASVVAGTGLALGGAAGPAAAAEPCAGVSREVFAVDGGTGHLHSVVSCGAAITDAGVVNTADWRAYQQVTASYDGTATEIFAVTGDGGLVRRTRPAAGRPFGPAVQVGAGYDWAGVRTLIATPKTLVVQFDRSPSVMRVFEVTAAGISEIRPLFEAFGAPHLSGINGQYAEVNAGGRHFRTWSDPRYGSADPGLTADQSWFSGDLPGDVHGLTGTERLLAGLDGSGRIVVLAQRFDWPYRCPYDMSPFTVRATSTVDGVVRVVVPGWVDPDLRYPPAMTDCPKVTAPWEWQ
ncbi:hypothetical protein Daura_24495 [Dactylosporangium aurantiacum]|uniref:Secreted protein n=1 Tax=Dactylosporangium aurantiacum TaxID=35754 RepID=A0A9Q9ITB5_9ACTN|nr:hypothetical protein [Dactylosporangium aurantiacum]MDG6103745.1 hypothetical protein [Dactylosporangium aurantiacum]UWZ59040.1 hypothetical protein Daura_24495 [Dactylosporangium aurantiacum]